MIAFFISSVAAAPPPDERGKHQERAGVTLGAAPLLLILLPNSRLICLRHDPGTCPVCRSRCPSERGDLQRLRPAPLSFQGAATSNTCGTARSIARRPTISAGSSATSPSRRSLTANRMAQENCKIAASRAAFKELTAALRFLKHVSHVSTLSELDCDSLRSEYATRGPVYQCSD